MIARTSPHQYLGCKPSPPDFRDHSFSFRRFCLEPPEIIPPKIDLRDQFTVEPYNQGRLGSCTANAIAAAIEFDQVRQKLDRFTPSRLFIYYNERDEEGCAPVDSGANLRDGMKAINVYGAPPETSWPYDISRFTEKPDEASYKLAQDHQALQYASVDSEINSIKRTIAGGLPVIFGFSVYDYFMTDEMASTGILKMPLNTETLQGGHAVISMGYDDDSQMLIIRNSYGSKWGQKGYFMMPYGYVTPSLFMDAWCLQLLEGDNLSCSPR